MPNYNKTLKQVESMTNRVSSTYVTEQDNA